jgi:predicted membrane channel-forming protein YqfA (hemolysin III family)
MVVVLFPRFRTPAWRPFRAFMFVAMGLSALFPVLHGIRTFGVAQLERQIGLSWLVTQGVLYILGAGIYAVSIHSTLHCGENVQQGTERANGMFRRLASRKSWRRALSTSGAVRTRYSMCWWCWLPAHT